jgi:hypothetical protein
LERQGVTTSELFGQSRLAYRRVVATSPSHVTVDFVSRQVALPRAQVSGAQMAGQWLKFEKVGSEVRTSVDAFATLRGERRQADLFATLFAR